MAALRLDWQKMLAARSERMLQSVLDNYSDIFKEDLGTVKGVKTEIYVDPEAYFTRHVLFLSPCERWWKPNWSTSNNKTRSNQCSSANGLFQLSL